MAFDREICALTIFCEASSASPQERRCIAHTIINRVRLGRYGKTPAAVCLKRYQFSEWNDDQPDNANLLRGAETPNADPVMQDCIAAIDEVRSGSLFDLTHGATHYHDKSIAPPNWTVGAECSLVTDKFFFYRNVR